MLRDGSSPKITLYVLRSNCTKFGAFVRCVPILVLSDLTIKREPDISNKHKALTFACASFRKYIRRNISSFTRSHSIDGQPLLNENG